MTNSSDEIIVLSDGEDDIKIESIVTAKRANKSPVAKQNATRINRPPPLLPRQPAPALIKRRAQILVLTEPQSDAYGIERGYKLHHIHGVKRSNNELLYLIEYESCDDYEFVPSTILCRYCNETMIDYLAKLGEFID